MPDQQVLETLRDNGAYTPPEEQDMSRALMALSNRRKFKISPEGVFLLKKNPLELSALSDLYDESSKGSEPQIVALCMAIEYAIALLDHDTGHGLKDKEVIAVLEKLGFKPEGTQSGLTQHIQAFLQLELSLDSYSRSDIRQALRRCLRSAQRHHKLDGERGFLNFIHHLIH